MKEAKIKLLGSERPMCFSTRVLCDAEEKFGGLEKMFDAMSSGTTRERMNTIFWVLAAMLKAGERRAQLNGEECPKAPDAEALPDLFGVDDLTALVQSIKEAIVSDSRRDVLADAPKNAEATADR